MGFLNKIIYSLINILYYSKNKNKLKIIFFILSININKNSKTHTFNSIWNYWMDITKRLTIFNRKNYYNLW